MVKAVQHRSKQLHMHGLHAFQRNTARRQWKRKELLDAQEMHDNMLMEMCTSHLVEIGLSKLQIDIERRTKALADGLQLVAPYAMYWLLKTRHRLQNNHAKRHARELGQENMSANCFPAPRQEELTARVKLMQHDTGRRKLSLQPAASQGSGQFPAVATQRRKQVCTIPTE